MSMMSVNRTWNRTTFTSTVIELLTLSTQEAWGSRGSLHRSELHQFRTLRSNPSRSLYLSFSVSLGRPSPPQPQPMDHHDSPP
jgi:hypothetical protein